MDAALGEALSVVKGCKSGDSHWKNSADCNKYSQDGKFGWKRWNCFGVLSGSFCTGVAMPCPFNTSSNNLISIYFIKRMGLHVVGRQGLEIYRRNLDINICREDVNGYPIIIVYQIMAIGDGENDVEMLELASLGIALSNESEKAKAVANVIDISNDEDGVADAIYRYAF
ncbi:haloacid dehalogenase-like hydrolase family protein [Striga asiatica]|uniref:Haloacid dehalogenase-like hydrolase family protein n=1 Tax=Striga asiatica TaxID=4170 RepID=A0A5A7Q404_STRAF|nr:haloacid dehalogenase-like hydrolase family protein [Striga asiatica]